MKAFITGSTGLLGSNLVQLLVAQGHSVKALVRSREKAERLIGWPNVQLVTGDMESVEGFARELAGCDVLFHTAAYFREYFGPGDHWATLEKINVQGTIQLLEAAEKAGIRKVIYTSSSGVIGARRDGKPGDEATPPDRSVEQNLYFRSKLVAERAIAAWLKTHNLPVVLILPTAIFGPQDAAPTAAGQIILDYLHGQLPAIPPGGFSLVDARDVAQAMLNAVERGQSGERYIINNRYYSVADIMRILEQVSGVPAPKLRLPPAVALTFAYVSEAAARLTGKPSQISVNAVRTLLAGNIVTMDKAVRELGATVRPFEDTLRDEVAWYRANGYVKTGRMPTGVRVA
jgi:dihydroflavonol-4-reductase